MLSVFNSAPLEAKQSVPEAAAAAAAQARFMLTVKVTREKRKTLGGNKRGERL